MVVWTAPPPAVLPPPLRRHVREMVGYRAEGMRPGVHRGLPSDTLTMVLAIGAPLRTATSWEALDAGAVDEQAVVLSGLHVRSALVLQPQAWEGIQLAVSPLGARALFGAPAAGLPVDHWDAADLLGESLRRLSERLVGTAHWPTRYALVTDFLLGRLAVSDGARPRAEVAEAWRMVRARRGAVRVDDVARHVGLGRRRLSTLFAAELGVTVWTAARLVRFDAARRALATRACTPSPGRSLDLAGLAVDHGYYDHAHLVREFGEFAGLSPTAWLAEEFPNVQAGEALRAPASVP